MAEDNTSVGKISLDIDLSQDLEKQIDNASKNIADELQNGLEKGLNIDGLLKSFTANIENTVKTSMDNIQRIVENSFKDVNNNINNSINTTRDKALKTINDISNAIKKIKIPQQSFIASNNVIPAKNTFNKVGNTAPNFNQDLSINERTQAQIDLLSRKMDLFSNKADTARERVNELKTQINELSKNTGNPILNEANSLNINKLKEDLAKATTEEEKFAIQSDSLNLRIQKLTDKMNAGANATNKNTRAVHGKADSFKNASDKGSIFGNMLNRLIGKTNEAENATKKHSSATDRLGISFSQVGRMMDRMLLRMVIFNTVVNGLTTFASFVGKALMTNAQFSNSLLEIKSNLMTAFMPIYNAALPALNSLMQALATATSYIASFISQLFGTTYKASFNNASALQNQIGAMDIADKQAKKAADSLGTVGNSANKANKAINAAADASKKGLAGFDEINKLGSNTTSPKISVPKTGKPEGSGVITPIVGTPNMAPIEAATAGWAKKFREILANIWKPFQQAWAAEGQNTINAAKYALGGIWDLIKAIGKSFYTVWTNGTGTKILTNMLKILQDIFNYIGDIGHIWANAWNKGNIGTQVVQNLANAFNNVLVLIDKMAKSTRTVLAEEGPKFADLFMQALKGTSGIIENVTEKLGWIWDHGGKHAYEGLLKLSAKVGELALFIYNQFVVPFVNWFVNMISPAIAVVLDILGSLFDKMSELINWLMGDGKSTLATIISLVVGVATAIKTWQIINTAVTWFKNIGGVIGILSNLKGSINGIFTTMRANPIATIIALIAGIITTLITLYNTNQSFHNAVNKLFSYIQSNPMKVLTSAIALIGSVSAAIGIAIGLHNAATIAQTAHTAAIIASNVALRGLAIAQGLVNAVMNANPIVLIIALIAALVVTIIGLYNNCTAFRDKVNEIFDWFKKTFGPLVDWIKDRFNDVKKGAEQFIGEVKDRFSKAHSDTQRDTESTLQNMENSYRQHGGGIKGIMAAMWEDIKGVFRTGYDVLNDITGGGFGRVVNKIAGFAQDIAQFFKSMANDVIWALNQMIGGLNTLNFSIPDWVPEIGGDKFGFDLSYIPYLAKGGVVNKATTAVIGESGREAVMPLENNTGWISELASKIGSIIIPAAQPKIAFAPSGDIQANRAATPRESAKEELKNAIVEAIKATQGNKSIDKTSNSTMELTIELGGTKVGKAIIDLINNTNRSAGKNLIRV